MAVPGLKSAVAGALRSKYPTTIGLSGNRATNVASIDVAYPAGLQAGDLILVIAGVEAGASRTLNTPSGYAVVASTTTAASNLRASYLFSKTATGAEGANLTLTVGGGNGNPGAIIIVLRDAGTVSASAFATGTGTGTNPPSLTPSFGTADATWFALMTAQSATLTSYPTGYDDDHTYISGGNPCVGAASKKQKIATDDPGNFTRGTSNGWHAVTVAIKGL